jgi:hypothetical protein
MGRGLQDMTRNSMSARSPMIGTDSVDIAKYRGLAHLAADFCSHDGTGSETSETSKQVLFWNRHIRLFRRAHDSLRSATSKRSE